MKNTYRIMLVLACILIIFTFGNEAQSAVEQQALADVIYLPLVLNQFSLRDILFTGRDNQHSVYLVKDDGSGFRNLSNGDVTDERGDWSPDGEQIVFHSNSFSGDYSYDIFRVNVDGSMTIKLTDDPAFDMHPSWSLDGKKIAFWSDRSGSWEIYVMDSNGQNVVQLTNLLAESPTTTPRWLLNGSKISFATYSTDSTRLILMDANGGNLEDIVLDDRAYSFLWSPDGNKLLFITENQNHDRNLYMMNMADRSTTKLPDTEGVRAASWSPDGRKIVYAIYSLGSMFIIDTDGGNKRELLCGSEPIKPSDTTSLDWSPDGTKIAYFQACVGSITSCGLFVVKVDNGSCAKIVDMRSGSQVKWRP